MTMTSAEAAVARTAPPGPWGDGHVHDVLRRHAEDVVSLWRTRTRLLDSPVARLHQLLRLDERIAGHLDGLLTAGDAGRRHVRAALADTDAATLFVATALAILGNDDEALDRSIALAQAQPEWAVGPTVALGWVSANDLRGVVARLLNAADPLRRRLGLEACVAHRVDPGPALAAAFVHPDPALRATACRAAGRLGRVDLLGRCRDLVDDAANVAYEAARAGVRLGDRDACLQSLAALSASRSPRGDEALDFVVKLLDAESLQRLLAPWAGDATQGRRLVLAIGASGQRRFAAWLIEQLSRPAVARVAGAALGTMLGVDLLERRIADKAAVDAAQGGETDVAAEDPDAELPWPDPAAAAVWWSRHSAEHLAPGPALLGESPTRGICLAALREAPQRRRIAAAQWLALIEPASPWFDTAAPAWRQQRRLAEMAALR